jgi:hypothetical protein
MGCSIVTKLCLTFKSSATFLYFIDKKILRNISSRGFDIFINRKLKENRQRPRKDLKKKSDLPTTSAGAMATTSNARLKELGEMKVKLFFKCRGFHL